MSFMSKVNFIHLKLNKLNFTILTIDSILNLTY